jgi:YD repeat-containing protein
MRQAGATNVYESADSTYTQLTTVTGGAVVVTSDGTQYTFVTSAGGSAFAGNEMRCTQIKDRNGNYISATYDAVGHIQTMTDTLGRVLSFLYDSNSNLEYIRQTWNGASHDWAHFYYSNIQLSPSFSNMTVNAPTSTVTVLTYVVLGDYSYYVFSYNSYGQVYKTDHYATDNRHLSYTSYHLAVDANGNPQSGAQTDCPRFTERYDWAYAWNYVNGVETAVTTRYSVAADGSWTQVEMPDGTKHKELFAVTTDWKNDLTIGTEEYDAAGTKQKWTTTDWTQDNIQNNTNISYQINPRPTDLHIYDANGNHKKTHIDYTSYSLPSDVREFAADATTQLRHTHTDYRTDSYYLNRRLIGLPSAKYVYEGANDNVLASKVDYHYDWDGYLVNQAPSVQFDSANYPFSFIQGRGNLVGVGCREANELWQRALTRHSL